MTRDSTLRMQPPLIITFCLGLSAFVAGCSLTQHTSVKEPSSAFRRGRIVSLSQALSPIAWHEFTNRTTEQISAPFESLELKSAETYFWPPEKWGRDALLLTIHSAPWAHADVVR